VAVGVADACAALIWGTGSDHGANDNEHMASDSESDSEDGVFELERQMFFPRVHTDIKPDNILLGDALIGSYPMYKRPLLTDFGDTVVSGKHDQIYTRGFVSPVRAMPRV